MIIRLLRLPDFLLLAGIAIQTFFGQQALKVVDLPEVFAPQLGRDNLVNVPQVIVRQFFLARHFKTCHTYTLRIEIRENAPNIAILSTDIHSL